MRQGVERGENKILTEKMKTAERLRLIRERMGCTQEVFANKLNISLSAYKKIEGAENNVSVNVLKKLNEMRISSDYVLFGEKGDVDSVWRDIQTCTEEDKLYLCIMLMLHFVETKGVDKNNDMDNIYGMVKKIIAEK